MASPSEAGIEALNRLKATEPSSWLAPNSALSQTARAASQYLFSSLRPFSQKSPLDQLLVDGFDAEQIWQQIDLQSQPLLSSIGRRVKQLQKNPEEISKLKTVLEGGKKVEGEKREDWNEESDGFDEELDEFDEDDDEGVEEKEKEGRERQKEGTESDDADDNEEEEEEGGESGESESEEDNEEGDGGGIEDKFLKIKELAKYLQKEEENLMNNEAGQEKRKGDGFDQEGDDDEEEENDDEDSDDGEESDEGDEFGLGEDEDEDKDAEDLENARYKDFFGAKREKGSTRKVQLIQGSEDSGDEDDMEIDRQNQQTISTHEKQLEKLQSKIEQMEKANLEPKTWTMQGEVTAAKRPKNSALEVDLDFEHNLRPAPVITEEVTASLEDMIQKRILEGRFDDVQRAPKLPSKAPRELKELDDNKSKKGLAEIYEEEYVQKTNLASAPLSFKDEQKKEASMLFKKLCLKLDALSHFHFTPKPVIEDMSVQANVPALAMEEIAPVAVSDAAMLAPEEVFAGKGDIREEAELTKPDRKRRRANKKRKYKADATKRMAKKAPEGTFPSQVDG